MHSTILLVSAWLLTRKARKHAETLWTAALLGGILTASLQVGLGYGSILGTVELPQSFVAIEAPANPAETVRQPRQARTREASRVPLPLLSAEPISTPPIPSPQIRLARSWGTFLAGFWLLGATLMAPHLGVQALRFRRRLTIVPR